MSTPTEPKAAAPDVSGSLLSGTAQSSFMTLCSHDLSPTFTASAKALKALSRAGTLCGSEITVLTSAAGRLSAIANVNPTG